MRNAKNIIVAALLASTWASVAGPVEPWHYGGAFIVNNQLQQIQAATQRREMDRMMRDELDRNQRLLQSFQRSEEAEKRLLQNIHP
jgi:hypothetical protein